MTDTMPVSIDDVRTLVAERHRFDEWLSALESRRSDTPDHVYARVYGDYVTRRDNVMSQLHAHVPGLEQLLGELDARATDFGLRSRAEEDERAEAMLRHAVGEYDDAKWEEVRNRVESTLASVGQERDALDAEREDVRRLLSSARPVNTVAATSQVAAVEPGADNVARRSTEIAAGTATLESLGDADFTEQDVNTAALPGEGSPHSNALDWLGSMTPASVPSLPADPRNTTTRAGSSDSVDAVFGETGGLDFTSDGAADHESVDVFGDARSSNRDAVPASDVGDVTSAPSAFDELAFLRSVIDPQASSPSAPSAPTGSPQAQKTLRCTECGTMNLPTEWYCERCGGELAAF